MVTAPLGTLLRHLHQRAATPAHPPSDRELLDDFAAWRDEAAFAALVSRHGPMVLRVCRRVLRHEQDAEDAFQATFLVLARHAGSIRKREVLASWLHGVAHRTAMSAKRSAARRRNRETGVAERPDSESPSWDDVQAVLDEEILRLPEVYRSAFVLCLLEGKSVAEAAAELAVKAGTVGSRLARARQRLQQRLTARGIHLAALLAATSVVECSRGAALPVGLARAGIRSGLLVAAGEPAAGVIPPHVAALAAGVTRAMFPTKTKIATVVLLAAGLFATGAGLLTCRALASKGQEAATAAKREQSKAADADGDSVTLKGQVLGPDGKSFAGAEVVVVTRDAKKGDLTVKATSDRDGRFRVSVSRSDLRREAKLVATAKGHGPDWIEVGARPRAGEVTLRLVEDDVPIRGRVLNLEGRPIVGASVTVAWVDAVDLKPWLADRAKGNLSAAKGLATVAFEGPAVVKTDETGRFTLRGFGRDRVAHLFVRAPGVEDNDVEVIARAGPVEGLRLGHRVVHPADATFTVLPCKPIVGTVRDKKTGEPMRGVRVVAPSRTWNLPGATTDEKGRYRIEGVGKRKDYMVAAGGGPPYFNSTQMQVADTPGLEPLTVDFDLERGVVVKGRLTDKATGKPVRGRVSYTSTSDNPNLKDFTDVGKPQVTVIDLGKTGDDGSFTVVCVPGPGLLTARADDRDAYPMARLEGVKNFGNRILQDSHAVVPIDPSETDPKSRVRDIALEAARSLAGNVVGPDGKPVAGVHAAGLHAVWYFGAPEKLPSASFKAHGLRAKEPRGVLFFQPEKRLAKVQKVAAEDKEPLAVRLEATGALAGRVTDAKGRPWAGLKVRASYRIQELSQARNDGKEFADLPWELLFEYPAWDPLLNRETTTDKDGKFRLDGLIPGLKYDLAISDGEVREYDKEVLSVESGKVTDLGELKARNAPAKEEKE